MYTQSRDRGHKVVNSIYVSSPRVDQNDIVIEFFQIESSPKHSERYDAYDGCTYRNSFDVKRDRRARRLRLEIFPASCARGGATARLAAYDPLTRNARGASLFGTKRVRCVITIYDVEGSARFEELAVGNTREMTRRRRRAHANRYRHDLCPVHARANTGETQVVPPTTDAISIDVAKRHDSRMCVWLCKNYDRRETAHDPTARSVTY